MNRRQMTKEEAIRLHNHLLDTAYDIMAAKRLDYSGDADPFKNFRLTEQVTGLPASTGVLVRLSDKFSRLGTVLAKDGHTAVENESLLDTVRDVLNYTVILYSLYLEEHPDLFASVFAEIPAWDDPEPDVEDTPGNLDLTCPVCKGNWQECACSMLEVLNYLNAIVRGLEPQNDSSITCPICGEPFLTELCPHDMPELLRWWDSFPQQDFRYVCPICHQDADTDPCEHNDRDVLHFIGEMEYGDREWYACDEGVDDGSDAICPVCSLSYFDVAECPHTIGDLHYYAWTIVRQLAEEDYDEA